MKKCLIVCWFGNFPKYFNIFEKTCSYNLDYDFLIFTDQIHEPEHKNIKIKTINLNDLKKIIEKKLNFEVKIDRPYKFCDFKPAYGDIFEEYIKDYEYFGYCDIDMLFGRINHFVKDDEIKQYEKINICGHYTLYKNNEKCRKLYKEKGSIFPYDIVYTNTENYAFDEYSGMKKIAQCNKIKTLEINEFADIDKRYSRYKCVNHINYNEQFFLWSDGELFRCYKEDNIIKKEEFMYLHFQKKHPNFNKFKINDNEQIIMGRDNFYIEDKINFDKAFENNKFKGNIYENIELSKYFFNKIISFFKCSKKEKIIWIKQKIC